MTKIHNQIRSYNLVSKAQVSFLPLLLFVVECVELLFVNAELRLLLLQLDGAGLLPPVGGAAVLAGGDVEEVLVVEGGTSASISAALCEWDRQRALMGRRPSWNDKNTGAGRRLGEGRILV